VCSGTLCNINIKYKYKSQIYIYIHITWSAAADTRFYAVDIPYVKYYD